LRVIALETSGRVWMDASVCWDIVDARDGR